MKICVLSDIHGNYDALKKCVNEAKKFKITKFICLGDYVGYYYEPDKCIDLLIKIKAVCIRGNHENIFLNILKDNKKIKFYKLKYGNGISIAYKKLKKKHINFIKGLSVTKKISFRKKKILLCHGSPWDINEYIYPNKFNNYKKKFNKYKYDYILLGHTHIPMNKKIGSKKILNPGSVGQPRDRDSRAKWLIMDLADKKYEFKKTIFNQKKIFKQVTMYDNGKVNLIKYFKK
tara:strand:+ start:11 stop:706 length:696 start_codon:yes stop_codon:yes gene_type:complete